AGLAGAEVEELALVVVDVEAGGLLLGERREADVLAPLAAQLHRLADDVGRAQARLDLVQEAFVEASGHGQHLPSCGVAAPACRPVDSGEESGGSGISAAYDRFGHRGGLRRLRARRELTGVAARTMFRRSFALQ